MGLFDFDGDGKISPWEDFLEYSLFEEFANDGTGEPGIGLFADDHKDDWRYDCEDGSEYDIDPWSYDTLEEYEEALEDARLDRHLYGDSGDDKENEDGEYDGDEDDDDEDDDVDWDDAEADNDYNDDGFLNVPERPRRRDYPNKRRYKAAEELAWLRKYWDGGENGKKRRERCRFILEKGDTVIAANYLTCDGWFLFAQAVKDHFELPCSLPSEDEESEYALWEVLTKLARYDVPLSLRVWDWCLEHFAEYRHFSSRDPEGGFLTESMLVFLDHFPDDYEYNIVQHMAETPAFLQGIMTIGDEPNTGFCKMISAALRLGLSGIADKLFQRVMDLTRDRWKMANWMTEEMLHCCRLGGAQVMRYFRDNMFPRIKAIDDGMVQDELPGWEKEIEEYLGETPPEREKPVGIEVRFPQMEKTYRYCRVFFRELCRDYSYLADNETGTLKPGDRVVVPLGKQNAEKVGFVVGVGRYTENTAPYPPQKCKSILWKEDDECKNEDDRIVCRLIEWLGSCGRSADEIVDCLKTVL